MNIPVRRCPTSSLKPQASSLSPRRGSALIVVLLVVSLLTLGGYTLSESMLSERKATLAHGRRLQALAAADSGVALTMQALSLEKAEQRDAGGLYDNATWFCGRLVADGASSVDRSRFTIVAPAIEDNETAALLRYGLQNESARLHLNALLADARRADAAAKALLALPGMTEEIADAIVDWIDEDDEPRPQGAEADYYSGLDVGYTPKNGPIDSLDELLLVEGVTPQLLYGLDRDRNGAIDLDEREREAELGIDNSDGALDYGWAAYLTLCSAETNLQADGTARIDLNGEDLEQLHTDLSAILSEEEADFVILYRQYGGYRGDDEPTGAAPALDLTKPGEQSLPTLLDLVGAKVQIGGQGGGGGRGGGGGPGGGPGGGQGQQTIVLSPFTSDPAEMKEYLPLLLDATTLTDAPRVAGRININLAPRIVLAAIPNIEPETVEAILSHRTAEDDVAHEYETWPLTEGLVDLQTMRRMLRYVTTGGDVFRGVSVGFSDGPGPSARIEYVIDASEGAPRLLLWRDVSHLGLGYPKSVLLGGG